jgi:hypothetical protein
MEFTEEELKEIRSIATDMVEYGKKFIEARNTLPHIRLRRSYWEIVKKRTTHSHVLMGCSFNFSKLKKTGPWRPAEINEWYGDTKKPV